jgi:coenzyme PQQ synthesis protein D (PqqD)
LPDACSVPARHVGGRCAGATVDDTRRRSSHSGLRDTVYYGLSAAGALIWRRLQEKCRVDQIASAIVSEFDVTRERALADLQALLGELESRGLITIDDPRGQ